MDEITFKDSKGKVKITLKGDELTIKDTKPKEEEKKENDENNKG